MSVGEAALAIAREAAELARPQPGLCHHVERVRADAVARLVE